MSQNELITTNWIVWPDSIINIYNYRKMWVNSIEEVKRKLEEDENMETEEGDDPLNPFSKQGETHHRSGKRKVVSARRCLWICSNSYTVGI